MDDALAELAGWVHGTRPLHELLDRVAAVAREEIPTSDEVSVTLVADPHDLTMGATGDVGRSLDERQRQLGRGPCLDAAYGGTMVLVDDMRAEPRWPRYAPTAVELGILSSLSVPLPVQEHVVAAVNWYSRSVGAFDAALRPAAEDLAARVAVLVTNAHLYGQVERLASQMHEAMASRAVIEQAKGVLMAATGCDAEAAFQLLVQQSQHENRKLRDVADEIVTRLGR